MFRGGREGMVLACGMGDARLSEAFEFLLKCFYVDPCRVAPPDQL